MAVVYGLLAALMWGVTDFMISVSGRSYGVHRAMLYAQSVGVVAIGLCMLLPIAQAPEPSSLVGWAAALLSAPIGVGATLALYQGLKVGKVSIVAPVTATFGAVTALLSLATGERLALSVLAGIGCVVAGAVLLGAQRRRSDEVSTTSGLRWALLASIGYGVQFWLQGRFAVPTLGSVLPVWLYYLTSTTLLLGAVPLRRQALGLPMRGAAWVAGTGLVAVSGFLVLSLGMGTGEVAVVAVLASLQSGVTVYLAGIFHRERLAPRQWLGLIATVVGLMAVHQG